MPNQTTIKCPNCQQDIDINKALYHKLENAFNKKIKEEAEKQLRIEKKRLEKLLKQEIIEEHNEAIELLKKELKEKSNQVNELNQTKAEIEKLKKEKDEIKSKIEIETQLALSEKIRKERAKIVREIEEQNDLILRQKDEQLQQIKRELEKVKRKVEQGSMQIQGEVLELAIESWLSSQFPFDKIEEVKKGAFGADCIQIINTRELQNCGVICYESKNTKAWSDSWITKLKQDMIKANADLGVLVTSAYPKSMTRMGFIDGIWVCSFDEFKGSSALLRESLIRIYKFIRKEENKTDKMTLLYNYMTSSEFAMQMKAIVDGFTKMQEELNKEKRSIMASWKRRQKIIDGVLTNTSELYGALQGIAGNSSIVYIDALELDSADLDR